MKLLMLHQGASANSIGILGIVDDKFETNLCKSNSIIDRICCHDKPYIQKHTIVLMIAGQLSLF
jgi:hypothetical protein